MTVQKPTTAEIIRRANQLNLAVPAFNIPYLPMMEPTVKAIVDCRSFALIEVARLEWEKFESRSPAAVLEEYHRWQHPCHMRIHLDHVPVIDEDGLKVDYLTIIRDAIAIGYESVMVDGSRLSLEENIAASRQVAELAHGAGVACEAELGAVLGHEAGPLPPYEELFATGKGFTDVDEARRFVEETGVDWLSVAVGNIHGNISKAKKDQKKLQARLDLDHLAKLADATGIPLVLHGGSGVQQEYVLKATQQGMTKINIGTDIRQPYEVALKETGDVEEAKQAVYDRTCWILTEYLQIENSQEELMRDGC
jgi:ketose-bisphosphate aldolase